MQWDSDQQRAIDKCCNLGERVVTVTGPAGTGKTKLLSSAFRRLSEDGLNCVLCAPTGKAASRIKEATQLPASTIHRLLEFTSPNEIDPKTGKPFGSSVPRKTSSNKLKYDAIFVDEYSMVNNQVHRALMDAMKPGCLLRAFGDINQLKPIENFAPSKVLGTQLTPFESLLKRFDGVYLSTNHRQGANSLIVSNAIRVLHGNTVISGNDFATMVTATPSAALEDYLFLQADKGVSYCDIDNQIICLCHSGQVGTTLLNAKLQNMFIKSYVKKIHIAKKDHSLVLHLGDKVIQDANNYEYNVFNGEIGIVVDVDEFYGTIHVDFGDKVVEYEPELIRATKRGQTKIDPRAELKLAYAVTTHKMQGSECNHAIYVMDGTSYKLQCRANLYTGLTRARQHVAVITTRQALERSLRVK